MKYKNTEFLIDGFKAEHLAKKFSTPLYCYSFNKIRENVTYFKNSFRKIKPLVCFAVKANSKQKIIA